MSLFSVDEAIKALNNQQVVALPTETVYGLAAIIDHDEALKKIFATKKRPFYDPLIVHVKSLEQAKNYAHWDPLSEKLAQHFWPGPLTIVLNKKENISNLITSGGPTVAFRQPDHPLFQEVLHSLQTPVAAPSANMFGKTSPTNAQHVLDEFANSVPVVDGGSCNTGIESTVIEVDQKQNRIKILRPGVLTPTHFQRFLQEHNIEAKIEFKNQENTPGYLKNHYQPTSPLFLIFNVKAKHDYLQKIDEELSIQPTEWILPSDPSLAARKIYSDLRSFSKNNQAVYLIVKNEWKKDELWQSLLDRLKKASHFLVRLNENHWVLERQ